MQHLVIPSERSESGDLHVTAGVPNDGPPKAFVVARASLQSASIPFNPPFLMLVSVPTRVVGGARGAGGAAGGAGRGGPRGSPRPLRDSSAPPGGTTWPTELEVRIPRLRSG